MLECIIHHYPDAAPKYQVANWRARVGEIIQEYSSKQIIFQPGQKLSEVVQGLEVMAVHLEDTKAKVMSVPIPPGKSALHSQLLDVLDELQLSFQDMVQSAKMGNMASIESSLRRNEEARRKIREFTELYLMSEL
jgi:hypothetical protein